MEVKRKRGDFGNTVFSRTVSFREYSNTERRCAGGRTKRQTDEKAGEKARRKTKKRQSLSDQLICMVMITFLPVNLLAIVVSSMILAHVSGQVKEFCQRDLDTVMDRIQEDLMETEDAFSDFLLDYMTELTPLDINSPMANYDMVTDLRDTFRKSSGDGFYYLFDRKENRIYLRCSTGLYSVGLVEEMKKALEEDQLTESDSWGFCPVAGKYFLCRQYDYLNYRIGFLLDMERFPGEAGGIQAVAGEQCLSGERGQRVFLSGRPYEVLRGCVF